MGWTSSDLARRLGVASTEIEIWENGKSPNDPEVLTRIEFLFRQAEIICDEIKAGPMAEFVLEESHLDQIPGDRVKDRSAD